MTGDGIRVEGADDLERVARAFREGDKDLQRKVSAAMRNAAKPLGEVVVRAGASVMPHRGGFAARVAATRVGVTNSLRGKSATVTIRARSLEGYDLAGLDRGLLRHPVFARAGARRVWASQPVPAGAFSAAFRLRAPQVQRDVLNAADGVLDTIARKA